jgi:hypothetical protein
LWFEFDEFRTLSTALVQRLKEGSMPPDDDIEFDFFEDLEPDQPTPPEESERGQRPPRGGPPRKSVRGPTGIAPLLRLAGLIAFGAVVTLFNQRRYLSAVPAIILMLALFPASLAVPYETHQVHYVNTLRAG